MAASGMGRGARRAPAEATLPLVPVTFETAIARKQLFAICGVTRRRCCLASAAHQALRSPVGCSARLYSPAVACATRRDRAAGERIGSNSSAVTHSPYVK